MAGLPYNGTDLNLGLHLPSAGGGEPQVGPMSDVQILAKIDEFKNTLAMRKGVATGSGYGWRLAPAWLGLWQMWGRSDTWNATGHGPGTYRWGDPAALTDPDLVSGKKPANLFTSSGRFPTDTMMHGLRDRGIIPQFTWQPTGKLPVDPSRGWYYSEVNSGVGAKPVMPNVTITAGWADAYLDTWVDDFCTWQTSLA